MKQEILRHKKLMLNKVVQVEVSRKKIAVIQQCRQRRRRLSHHKPHRLRHRSGHPCHEMLQKLHKQLLKYIYIQTSSLFLYFLPHKNTHTHTSTMHQRLTMDQLTVEETLRKSIRYNIIDQLGILILVAFVIRIER